MECSSCGTSTGVKLSELDDNADPVVCSEAVHTRFKGYWITSLPVEGVETFDERERCRGITVYCEGDGDEEVNETVKFIRIYRDTSSECCSEDESKKSSDKCSETYYSGRTFDHEQGERYALVLGYDLVV